MLSQTAVFTRRVGEYKDAVSAIAVVGGQATCREAVAALRRAAATAAVVSEAGRGVGILTERDVSHRLAFQVSPDTPVRQVMTTPLETIAADDYLYRAVARMRHKRIRHLPVVDANGAVIGLLELDRVLAEVSGLTVRHIDLLDHDGTLQGLRAVKAEQFRIAAQLLAEHVPGVEIQALLTRLNRELYQEATALCLADMSAAGRGAPPVPFEVIVMGSGGRGENYLTPDQDNGLILSDYPDSEHTRIDAWFREFSRRLNDALDAIGFAYCNGHVMASNPLWRKTLSQWCRQISGWIGKGEGNFLRLCDIFFDFACVHGDGELTRSLREHVTARASQVYFLREMYRVDEDHKVALGPFGMLLKDRLPGPNKGKINLKITGTLPLVGAVRIWALRHRIAAASTLDRIDALYQQQALSANERDDLQSAYRHIAYLLLRQQLRDAEAGSTPGNHLHPDQLSRRERRLLVDSFRAIRAFRRRLRSDLTGDVF